MRPMNIMEINRTWGYLIKNAAVGSITVIGVVIMLDYIVGMW